MSERILVVDDDRDTADTMAKLIQSLGFETRAVYDGQRAIDEVVNFQPDMVLLDIGMPFLDGYETVQQIRQKRANAHMILVAVTGWSRDEDKRRAYEVGFDLHVVKPMSVDTLKEILALLNPAATDLDPGQARQ